MVHSLYHPSRLRSAGCIIEGIGASGHTVIVASDVYFGLFVLGGGITALWSIAITVLNYSKSIQIPDPEQTWLLAVEPDTLLRIIYRGILSTRFNLSTEREKLWCYGQPELYLS